MDALTIKLLEELIDHLKGSEGQDFKSAYDESIKPKAPLGVEGEEAMEGSPKGIEIDKISALGKPEEGCEPGEKEMDDEELKELLSKLTG